MHTSSEVGTAPEPPAAWSEVLLASLLALAVVAIPILARTSFGVLPVQQSAVLVVEFGVIVVVSFAFVAWCFRLLRVRGASFNRAAVLASLGSLGVTVSLALVILLLERAFPALSTRDANEPDTIAYHAATILSDAVPVLLIWAALFFFPLALRKQREQTVRLTSALQEAERVTLRAHLEPHFVLNTLNAIAGLLGSEPALARELVGTLGDLLRRSFDASPTRLVREELEWLQRYVRIFELRFPEQLVVTWDIEEAAVSRAVPSMLWQPLVENALRHGALQADGGGRLTVRIQCEGDGVRCDVRDNGPALQLPRAGGQGLSLVQRRLALHGWGPLLLRRDGEETVASVTTGRL